MPDIVIHVIACAAYVGLAWHFWNTRWRQHVGGGLRGWERAAILVPLALHGWLLYDGIFAAPELRFGFAQALSVMTWLAVLAYWSESLVYKLDGMEPLVLLAAAATVTLPAFFPGLASSGAHAQASGFKLHLALAMAAYGLFLIALVMFGTERQVHAYTDPGSGALIWQMLIAGIGGTPLQQEQAALERLSLAAPATLRERALRALVLGALRQD